MSRSSRRARRNVRRSSRRARRSSRRARRSSRRYSRNSALGSVFLTKREATPSMIKSITSRGNVVTVVSGSINNPTTRSYVSSSSGRKNLNRISNLSKTRNLNAIREEKKALNELRLREEKIQQKKLLEIKRRNLIEQRRKQDSTRRLTVGLVNNNVSTLSRREARKLNRRRNFKRINTKIFSSLNRIIPPNERGVLGIFPRKIPSKYTQTTTPFASGQGTSIITPREKNFFEKMNINPNSKIAKDLKSKVTQTQNLLNRGVITESQAKKRNGVALKKFQSKQILRGLPKDFALGVGFALLNTVPIIGTAASIVLGTDLILKRKQIIKQFKNFPLESTASLGAFVVGGAITPKLLSGISSMDSIVSGGKGYIVIEAPKGIRKTPLSETFPKEFKLGIDDTAIKNYLKRELSGRGYKFDGFIKEAQDLMIKRVREKIAKNPSQLIPKARIEGLNRFMKESEKARIKKSILKRLNQPDGRVLLEQLKKLKESRELPRARRVALKRFQDKLEGVKRGKRLSQTKRSSSSSKSLVSFTKEEQTRSTSQRTSGNQQQLVQQIEQETQKLRKYNVVDREISDLQRLTLKRLREAQRNPTSEKVQRVRNASQKLIQKIKEKFKQKQRQLQKQLQKESSKQRTYSRQILITVQKTKQKQKQRLPYVQLQKQLQKLRQKKVQAQKEAQKQKQSFGLGTAQVLRLDQTLRQAIPQIISQKERSKLISNKKKSPKKRLIRSRKIIRNSKKPHEGYNVYVKVHGKFIKANTKPLSKTNAKDRRAYIIDHSTAATSKMIPIKKVKRLGSIKPKEFEARRKVKARNYRIVKGKKVPLLNTIIERRGKPRINTRGEKRGLSAARLIKKLNKGKSIKTKTKISSTKRKELLKRLEKARAIRMKNIKKRKR